jgi:hypothetical protein
VFVARPNSGDSSTELQRGPGRPSGLERVGGQWRISSASRQTRGRPGWQRRSGTAAMGSGGGCHRRFSGPNGPERVATGSWWREEARARLDFGGVSNLAGGRAGGCGARMELAFF